MPTTTDDSLEHLRVVLEDAFRQHVEQLEKLTLCRERPDRGSDDADLLAGLVASARQGVADSAQALRRMAEGSYGVCERCGLHISYDRLTAVPHAQDCDACHGLAPGH